MTHHKLILTLTFITCIALSGWATTPPVALTGSCSELLTNGDFESGTLDPWVASSNHGNTFISTVRPHKSTYSALFGNANNADDQLYQIITLPPDATSLTLNYWHAIFSDGVQEQDLIVITLRDGKGERLTTLNTIHGTGYSGWYEASHDLSRYAGQSVQIHFRATTNSSNRSDFTVDDVSVEACSANTATAIPTSAPTSTPQATATPSRDATSTATAEATSTTMPQASATPTPSEQHKLFLPLLLAR